MKKKNLWLFNLDLVQKTKLSLIIVIIAPLITLISFILVLQLVHGLLPFYRWVEGIKEIINISIIILALFPITFLIIQLQIHNRQGPDKNKRLGRIELLIKSKFVSLRNRIIKPTKIGQHLSDRKKKRKALLSQWEKNFVHISKPWVLLTLILCIILPLTFVSISTIKPPQNYDKDVQVWFSDIQGINGIPNVGISFWTEDLTRNTIQWGKLNDLGINNTELDATQIHLFILNDLEQNSSYWFKINSGEQFIFQTPNLSDGFQLAFVSDSHITEKSNPVVIQNLNNVLSNNNEMIIHGGDLVDAGWDDLEWVQAFQILSNYSTKIPTRVLMGNHDAGLNGNQVHLEYCVPDGLDSISSTYRKIDIGDNIHLIMLDLEWSDLNSVDDTQLNWLNKTLSEINPSDWTLIFCHAPIYSSYIKDHIVEEGFSELFTPLFIQYDVDMVFSGHTHIFEHLQSEGVNYFQCSRIGTKQYEIGEKSPYSIWESEVGGFAQINIQNNHATVAFVNVSNDRIYETIINT